jgi:hypothetical protein
MPNTTVAHIDGLGGRRVLVPENSTGVLPVLGDSFVFGVGVDDDETFVSRLAHDLSPLRLVNLGVPGTALVQQMEMARERHDELKRPKKYVFAIFLGNDFADLLRAMDSSAAKEKEKAKPESDEGFLWRINAVVYNSSVLRKSYLIQLVREAAVELLHPSAPPQSEWEDVFFMIDRISSPIKTGRLPGSTLSFRA